MDLTRKNENPLNPGIPGEGWCCVRYLYYSSIKTSQSFRSDLCKTALSNLLGVSPAASYPLFCTNDPRKFLRWKEAWKLQIFDDPLGALITGGCCYITYNTPGKIYRHLPQKLCIDISTGFVQLVGFELLFFLTLLYPLLYNRPKDTSAQEAFSQQFVSAALLWDSSWHISHKLPQTA